MCYGVFRWVAQGRSNALNLGARAARVKRDAGLMESVHRAKRGLTPSIDGELRYVGASVVASGVKRLTLFADPCVVNRADDQ